MYIPNHSLFPLIYFSIIQSNRHHLLRQLNNLFPILFPFILLQSLIIFLMLIQFDNISLGDFNIDDFSLAE